MIMIELRKITGDRRDSPDAVKHKGCGNNKR